MKSRIGEGRGCPDCWQICGSDAEERRRRALERRGEAVTERGTRAKIPALALAGLISALVGLFALPVIFSSVGIILGVAAGRNRRGVGWTAILVGAGGLAYYVYQVVTMQAQIERLFG
jgi:hypothetical protein